MSIANLSMHFMHCLATSNLTCGVMRSTDVLSDTCLSCLESEDASTCIPSLVPEGLAHREQIPPAQETKIWVSEMLQSYQSFAQLLKSEMTPLAALVNASVPCN